MTDTKILELILSLKIDQYINKSTLNLEDGGYTWDLKTAQIACDRYKKFLFLIKKFGVNKVEVDKLQDMYWHLHILDTKKYQEDCNLLFGFFLHHDPFPNPK